jgi:hypothetical protein
MMGWPCGFGASQSICGGQPVILIGRTSVLFTTGAIPALAAADTPSAPNGGGLGLGNLK